jgi:hypothetical protein
MRRNAKNIFLHLSKVLHHMFLSSVLHFNIFSLVDYKFNNPHLMLTNSFFLKNSASVDNSRVLISKYCFPKLSGLSESVFHLFFVSYR